MMNDEYLKQRTRALLVIRSVLIIFIHQIKKITSEEDGMIMQLTERTTIREIKKHKQNIVYVVPTSEKNMQSSEKM